MKRRSFLQTGAWSMAGVALPSPVIFQGVLKSKSRSLSWFDTWVNAIAAARKNYLFQQPEALRIPIDQVNAAMAVHKFYPIDKGLYFSASGDTCFYPLIRKNAYAGLQELLVPVLQRQSDGSWEAMTTITEYQMEAMAQAVSDWTIDAGAMHEWLLPVSPVQEDHSFRTRRGTMRIETWAGQGAASTHIQLSEGKQLRYDKRFDSRQG